MAGEVTRQEARQQVREMVERMLDKHIPEDPNKPVKDGLFWEWEDMADEFDREVTGTFVEVLACLSGQASAKQPGPCPFCGSKRVRWLGSSGQRERRSKHGEVVLPRQVAQCRVRNLPSTRYSGVPVSGPNDADQLDSWRNIITRKC